jgi:WD40 repeat protein
MTRNDSLLVCSAGKDKSIKLWDLTDYYNSIKERVEEKVNKELSYSTILEEFKSSKASIVKTSVWTEIAHTQDISFIRVSHNEKLVASGSLDKSVIIWKLKSTRHGKSNKESKESKGRSNENKASTKGRSKSKSKSKQEESNTNNNNNNNKPEISQESSLTQLFELKGHTRAVSDLAFSKVSKIAATGSTDKTVKIWDLGNGRCLSTLTGHLAAVNRVEWVYFDTHLISTGGDGLVKLWNIKTSENVITMNCHDAKIWGLAIVKPCIELLFNDTDANNSNTNINRFAKKVMIQDFNDNFNRNNFIYTSTDNYSKKNSNTNNNNIDVSALQLNFITGGGDSTISLWTDVTANREIEFLRLKEQRLMKEEQLRLITSSKSYVEAMRLALELNHKRDFYRNFVAYIDEHKRKRVSQKYAEFLTTCSKSNYNDSRSQTQYLFDVNQESNDNVSLIISNRRILESFDVQTIESNNINSNGDADLRNELNFFVDFNILTNDLRVIVLEYITTILEVVRDNNVKSSTYIYSQILLKCVMLIVPYSTFLGSKMRLKGSRKLKKGLKSREKVDSENAGKGSALDILNNEFLRITKENNSDGNNNENGNSKESKYNKVDFVENFAIVKSYTEKHLERLNREITMTYMLDSILENLFLIPS